LLLATITSNYRTYTVSIKDVDDVEIKKARRVLRKMNFDRRFKLKII